MTNILIKKEIFSANYKYSDQKGNILIKKEKFSPVEKKEEISLSSWCSLRLLKVEPVRGEENNVDHDQENLKGEKFRIFKKITIKKKIWKQCWSWPRKPKNGKFYEILKFNPNKIKYVYYYNNQGHLHRKPNFTELVNESKDVLAEEEERTSLNISFSKSNIPHAYLIFVTNV